MTDFPACRPYFLQQPAAAFGYPFLTDKDITIGIQAAFHGYTETRAQRKEIQK
jgi:hypothetical protein